MYGIFLERPSIYYVKKKSKIVRVTARSILAGMTHILLKKELPKTGEKAIWES